MTSKTRISTTASSRIATAPLLRTIGTITRSDIGIVGSLPWLRVNVSFHEVNMWGAIVLYPNIVPGSLRFPNLIMYRTL
jgi:hypothetical protein